MACVDCLNNCPDIIRDKCIEFTGDNNDVLDICKGDSLFTTLKKMVVILESYTDGTGITIEELTGCSAIATTDSTLPAILRALYNSVCALRTDVTELQGDVNPTFSFDTGCLEGSLATRDEILQATITKACDIDTRLETVEGDYVKATDLCTLVTACTSGAATQWKDRMVPHIAYPYHGSLTNFDSSGTGLTANGFANVYLCVGQTISSFVLPDYRGRSPLGVNTGVPGGALDSAVDPALAANAGYSIINKQKKGSFTDTLTLAQSAAHTHGVTDPGHTHTIVFGYDSTSGNNNPEYAKLTGTGAIKTTDSSITGITVGSSGGNQPHNSTHPIIGCNFIMYVI